MLKMKYKDKKVYLNKLIDYLQDNGWHLCNYTKREFSECDELRRFLGVALLHEKFDLVKDIVELFEAGLEDEAMDMYNSEVGPVSDESFVEYYQSILDNTNGWFV